MKHQPHDEIVISYAPIEQNWLVSIRIRKTDLELSKFKSLCQAEDYIAKLYDHEEAK